MTSHHPLFQNLFLPRRLRAVALSMGRWPLGVHLLLAVNIPLGALLTVLMVLEYQNSMDRALAEKKAGLADEAVAVHQAILHLIDEHPTGAAHSVAGFVERVCAKMQNSRSPGHLILVARGQELIHSDGHGDLAGDADTALMQTFRQKQSQLWWRRETIVLGGHAESGTTVVIAELATHLQRRARMDVLWRLGGLIAMAILAVSIMDAVLWRLIRKPVRRMSATVDAVARGEFGIQLEVPVGRELQALTRSFNVMSTRLAMNESHRQCTMQQAREIQEHLLPNGIHVPGLSICRHFQPAEDVAGDYYDFIPLSNGFWVLVVADVAGHGIPAAMAATIFKALLLCASKDSHSPDEIIARVNGQFVSLLPSGRFVTAILAIWQPDSRCLTYVNAGHPAGLLWNPRRQFRELDATQVPVGVMEHVSNPQPRELKLMEDDRLVWFTDGLIEAFSPSGEMFGRERLQTLIGEHGTESPQLLMERILEAVREFVGDEVYQDDLTLLVMG